MNSFRARLRLRLRLQKFEIRNPKSEITDTGANGGAGPIAGNPFQVVGSPPAPSIPHSSFLIPNSPCYSAAMELPIIESILQSVAGIDGARLLDLRVGPFWTAVRTTRGTGLASTMAGDAHRRERTPIARAGDMSNATPSELAAFLRSESLPEAAVGLATVNALVDGAQGEAVEDNAREILKRRAQGRSTAMIGHFPFADSLRQSCRELWVFERGRGRRPGDLGEEHFAELLPRAEVVAISATTLINHTLDQVLSFVSPEAFLMMLGPSTPMISCLFDLGFDALCGTRVDDPDRVLSAVGEGAVTSQIAGVRRLCLWRDKGE